MLVAGKGFATLKSPFGAFRNRGPKRGFKESMVLKYFTLMAPDRRTYKCR